jgi:hypothetical protein
MRRRTAPLAVALAAALSIGTGALVAWGQSSSPSPIGSSRYAPPAGCPRTGPCTSHDRDTVPPSPNPGVNGGGGTPPCTTPADPPNVHYQCGSIGD